MLSVSSISVPNLGKDWKRPENPAMHKAGVEFKELIGGTIPFRRAENKTRKKNRGNRAGRDVSVVSRDRVAVRRAESFACRD